MVENHLFLRISGVIYLALGTNVLLAIASLPLLVVSATLSPAEGLLPYALASAAAVPGVMAAFAAFRSYSDEGSVSVVRSFLSAWWAHLPTSLPIGAALTVLVSVLAVDIVWASGSRVGAVAIPVLVAAIIGAVAVALGVLTGRLDRPDASLRSLAKASVYLMARRWYLTLASVGGLLALGAIVATQPVLGLGVAAAPLLYLVWANTRYSLQPILRKA